MASTSISGAVVKVGDTVQFRDATNRTEDVTVVDMANAAIGTIHVKQASGTVVKNVAFSATSAASTWTVAPTPAPHNTLTALG